MPRPKKNTTKRLLEKKPSIPTPTTLKGMKDILPKERVYWEYIEDKFREFKEIYSFKTIDTPLIENPILYTGLMESDADKSDSGICFLGGKGKQKISLRPDIRTSIVRAVILHNLADHHNPIKLCYYGQVFNCEKEGRVLQYKRRYLMGFEVLGEDAPAVDAHLIMVGYLFLKELGLNSVVNINSIGDLECRELYKEALTDYFKQYKTKLDTNQKKLLKKNPFALLKSKSKRLASIIEGAPQIVDYLNEESKKHFFSLLEYLDDLDIPYNLDPLLLKDFEYYNRTVFDFYPIDKKGRLGKYTYGGGGRYDFIIQRLGGKELPSCGLDLDVERIVLEMKTKKIKIEPKKKTKIFLAQISEPARRYAMKLFEQLRKNGLDMVEGFVYNSLRMQLELANRMKVPYILILGLKEVNEGTILFRDVEGGIQEVLDLEKLIPEIKSRLKIK